MLPSDKPQFLKVLNGMAAMRKAQLLPEVLDLWWACMSAWTIEDFKAAAVHVLKSSEFMPTPKDFEDLRKAGEPTAGEAWARVLESVRNGSYRWEGCAGRSLHSGFAPPTDALTAASVRAIGGYEAIAMHEEATLHFLERRFCEHYAAIGEREQVREALPQIASRPDWLQLQMQVAQKKLTQ